MLISSRGRYALLVMIDLAGHRGGLVPGRQIAERLELSQKYLERILRTLAEAGVEIMSCGTCLNHYGLAEQLEVGEATNMYVIVEKQASARGIIRP